MASREGDGRQDGRHRRADEPTPPPRRNPAVRTPRRDSLTPDWAVRAVWATRYWLALINLSYGLGFVLGAPTDSNTYRLMESALRTILRNPDVGMWTWGILLMAAAPLVVFGAIKYGAPLAAATWLCFAAFNVISGAFAGPVFVGYAGLYGLMSWFIVRGRLPKRIPRARAPRQGR